ncbi:hypothetical protein ACFOY4_33530 [Actinomadura syzygii]|uniref:SlyX family protein n=1 Tax=Actinomadura syzygii TaxID=1427538 RepID=A0A5D0UB89_9ACTN|nr:hypothetical protein [Actinomadura syzygii]TYC15016.1 hypothetical protein FXF65_12880 [Actinomadura syzygii]
MTDAERIAALEREVRALESMLVDLHERQVRTATVLNDTLQDLLDQMKGQPTPRRRHLHPVGTGRS